MLPASVVDAFDRMALRIAQLERENAQLRRFCRETCGVGDEALKDAGVGEE